VSRFLGLVVVLDIWIYRSFPSLVVLLTSPPQMLCVLINDVLAQS
jgi:hypothetical protein